MTRTVRMTASKPWMTASMTAVIGTPANMGFLSMQAIRIDRSHQ
jgi:hypothetical protein